VPWFRFKDWMMNVKENRQLNDTDAQ